MTTTLQRPSSENIYNLLCQVIPGGVNSPVRAAKSLNLSPPMVIDRGQGDMIYDADGHAYIDYCGSWGALIHGHAHPVIIEAAKKRMEKGTSFGITTSIEEQIARKIISILPSIEKIRFVSSGTEATMSAVRLARGYTGRDLIVKFSGNYHGHADHFLVQAGSGVFGLTATSSSEGVPQDLVKHTACLTYNDLDACRKFFSENGNRIAAVILEPVAGNMGVVPAKKEFIHMLREETKKSGALLIFDEVITGFRIGYKGAQEYYKVTPDLTCLGKIIGGGFPAAAFGGRTDIMDCLAPIGKVYQAGTLSGNPIAMEAGYQALKLLEAPGFYEMLERKTAIITEPVREFLKTQNINACMQQVGSMFTLFFGRREVNSMEDAKGLDTQCFAEFFRCLFEQGIYIPPSQYEAWFVSSVHEDRHLEKTRDGILKFLGR